MSREEVCVSDILPGDLVETYNGDLYVKNIYRSEGDVSSNVVSIFGECVTIEYTNNKTKCNSTYFSPEYQRENLDYSVQTPSIYPLKSKIVKVTQ